MIERKSARFRVGQCFSPYPVHYRRAFAFSAFLHPHVPCGSPAVTGSTMGLPCSTSVSERGGPFLFAGGLSSMVAQFTKATPYRVPFWFKPVSTFGLLMVTTFIRSSHMLVVSAHPLLLSAFVLADSAWPRGSAYRLSGGYVVPRASHRAVAGSACPGRERLMEQPVSSGHTFSSETETQATFRSHVNIHSNELAKLLHDLLSSIASLSLRFFGASSLTRVA